jgi:hypothetical protein
MLTPRVEGDSLIGLSSGGLAVEDSSRRMALALTDVVALEHRASETVLTLAIIAGVILLAAVIFDASGGVMGNSGGTF